MNVFTDSEIALMNGENSSIHHLPSHDRRLPDDNDSADRDVDSRRNDRQLELSPGDGVR